MTLVKKADVPAYRAARKINGLHLVKKPEKASEIEQPKNNQPVGTNPKAFVDDFSLDHSAAGGTVSAKVFPDTSNEADVAKEAGTKIP